MKLEKKDYILIGVFVALILALFIIVRIQDKKAQAERDAEANKEKYVLVNDKSTFFTVESCANRYILSLCNNNTDDLLKLIDQDYIENHGLNKNNIVKHLGALDDLYTIKAKKMYYVTKGNIKQYYVYGLIRKNFINEYDYGKDYYLIVNVDSAKQLFSIEPYDGEYFKEAN